MLGDGCDRDFYYYYLTSLKTHFENISKGVAQNDTKGSVPLCSRESYCVMIDYGVGGHFHDGKRAGGLYFFIMTVG